MKKFRTKSRRNYKICLFLFIICFLIGFFMVFSSFINPSKIIDYIDKKYFKNENLTTWYFNNLFGTKKVVNYEEEIGKMEYVPDPNPLENKSDAVVYIYNTHQTEDYYIDVLMEHDIIPSVMTASYILREKLNKLDIRTMVETNDIMALLKENNWDYSECYRASRIFMEEAYQKEPTLNYFIDLHRDSIPYEASTLVYNNISYAKILFVIGKENENYLKNKELANKISEEINKKVPNLSRGIMEKEGPYNNGVYNQDFNSNVILIELGGSYNSIKEVSNTLDILSLALKEVID